MGEEKIKALVTLKCECRFFCLGKKEESGELLQPDQQNSVRINCQDCFSLGMEKIIVFNPD